MWPRPFSATHVPSRMTTPAAPPPPHTHTTPPTPGRSQVALGLWGVVPVLHGWALHAGDAAVTAALLDMLLMGTLYIVRVVLSSRGIPAAVPAGTQEVLKRPADLPPAQLPAFPPLAGRRRALRRARARALEARRL